MCTPDRLVPHCSGECASHERTGRVAAGAAIASAATVLLVLEPVWLLAAGIALAAAAWVALAATLAVLTYRMRPAVPVRAPVREREPAREWVLRA